MSTKSVKKWLQAKINSGSSLEAVTTCELCKEKLQLNLEDFDIHELHRAHANEQVSIFCLIWLSMSLSALVST